MPNQIQSFKKEKIFDLGERTARFGEDIIVFLKEIKLTPINESIIRQLIRCATSVGANYMEADGGESKRDFIHKIGICKKESKESMYWLRILAKAEPNYAEQCRVLWKEVHELALIFSAIVKRK